MIITKFGGTSVGNATRIKKLVEIVSERLGKKPIVVVSALSGVTDLLLTLQDVSITQKKRILKQLEKKHLDLINELDLDKETVFYVKKILKRIEKMFHKKKFSLQDTDELISNGEILSSYIVAKTFEKYGIESQQVVATELIVTNEQFGGAEFIPAKTKLKVRKKILPLLKKKIVPVITGFIGATSNNKTTTLGRGGSDYSASIIGYSLQVEEIQIWTDVDGILTSDPRLVKDAQILPVVSFREASELATFGARVLHPRTIKPAMAAKIPVRVLNSFNPQNQGTTIVEKTEKKRTITAIAFKKHTTLINIYSSEMLLQKGFLARVSQVFAENNISIDLVSVSEMSISVTLDNENNLIKVLSNLKKFSTVTIEKNLGIVSLIGESVVASSNIVKNIFTILDQEGIAVRMVSLGAIDINMSIVIPAVLIEKAVLAFHKKILLKDFQKSIDSTNEILVSRLLN